MLLRKICLPQHSMKSRLVRHAKNLGEILYVHIEKRRRRNFSVVEVFEMKKKQHIKIKFFVQIQKDFM